jgi:hypothetical protein
MDVDDSVFSAVLPPLLDSASLLLACRLFVMLCTILF